MIYIGLIPDITNIKFLTNMVAHYVLSADVSTKADVVMKHISLRELRIELTAKGFDYCLPSEIILLCKIPVSQDFIG